MMRISLTVMLDQARRLDNRHQLGIDRRRIEPVPRDVVERPGAHAWSRQPPISRNTRSLALVTANWRSSWRSSARRRSRSLPVTRPIWSRNDGMLPSIVCNSASSWARSSDAGGTASSASTVHRSGVTSARPPATKKRSAIALPSYMSIVPGRIVEISGECPGRTPKLPSVPGTTTISTSRDTSSCSGVTSSNWIGIRLSPSHGSRHGPLALPQRGSEPAPDLIRVWTPPQPRSGEGTDYASRRFRRHPAGLLDRLLDRADHIERGFRHLVIFAGDDALEALDRVFEIDEHAGAAGEHLGDMERLRQEALDFARSRDGQLVLFRQLVHPEDRDDVLQRLVGLQDALHVARDLIMLLADDARVEHARGRVERIDGRVNAQLGNLARQHGRRVQMRERGRRCRVRQIVRGDVDRLHRRDRTLLGRRDALLQRS